MELKTLLFILCIPFSVFGQLSGTYCYRTKYGPECFTFKDGKEFEYALWGCGNPPRSKGTYTLEGDKLTLHHKEDSSYVAKIERVPTDKEMVTLRVAVINAEYMETVPMAHIVLLDDSGHQVVTTTTDFYGTCSFTIAKSAEKQTLQCSLNGYQSVSHQVVLDSDHNIQVRLIMGSPKRRADYDTTYRLKRITKRRITLKEDKLLSTFQTYIKSKRSR